MGIIQTQDIRIEFDGELEKMNKQEKLELRIFRDNKKYSVNVCTCEYYDKCTKGEQKYITPENICAVVKEFTTECIIDVVKECMESPERTINYYKVLNNEFNNDILYKMMELLHLKKIKKDADEMDDEVTGESVVIENVIHLDADNLNTINWTPKCPRDLKIKTFEFISNLDDIEDKTSNWIEAFVTLEDDEVNDFTYVVTISTPGFYKRYMEEKNELSYAGWEIDLIVRELDKDIIFEAINNTYAKDYGYWLRMLYLTAIVDVI